MADEDALLPLFWNSALDHAIGMFK